MNISLIAAIDDVGGLGYKNRLLLKSKEDMVWFKSHTVNKICVYGRKTYESIGKPLPHRINVVLTRDKNYNPHPNVLVRHSVEDILNEFQNEKELMICGGSEIYKLFMSHATRLYITRFHHKFDKVDSYFPPFDTETFREYFFKEGQKEGLIPLTYHVYKKPLK